MSIDLSKIADRVAAADSSACRLVTGFDGFVDEMITLVDERRALDDFTPVPDIATFGAMISAAAGHSSLREIVVTDVHPGGCAVNLADGLASLGVKVDCFATLGEPMHSAYAEIAAKCSGFHSWGREPGRTLAFEFNDGKLMFSAVKQLADFTPESVQGFLADGKFATACAAADVIALTDWTLYPHMTEVWKMLQREVFSKLTRRTEFFIDLVDPSSRSASDIINVASILRDFEPAGPLTLGLNGNEANILCRLHDLPSAPSEATPEETLQQAVALRDLLGISRVVIHRIPFAVSASVEGGFTQPGPYCANPKKSTGAGDRFNAGFCLGLALALGDAESLALGCAVSGFFVRNARSASQPELVGFLRNWDTGTPDLFC
ncbi:MAG: carbohydrate kinase [Gloeobacteraceae cyanobacterium ES-bin-144]|nr:carbohydrate kinase [Verrucomicrobiales bacterium]